MTEKILLDAAELGLMQCMVTVTANDSSPEMLAAIRRGPFAQPTEEEHIEYLLQRKRRDQEARAARVRRKAEDKAREQRQRAERKAAKAQA